MDRHRAEKLIQIARECLLFGKSREALNYLSQAQSIYPTRTAARLISGIREACFRTQNAHSEPRYPQFEQRDYWDSHQYGFGTNDEPTWEEEEEEAEEEERLNSRMEAEDDYYSLLGVSKDANEETLRKAYLKLALKYHPDKNSSPGATEAFKAIGKAFSVLSDPAQRKSYDDAQTRARVVSQPDLSTEDLFDLFFKGHFPGFAFSQQYHQPRSTNRRQGDRGREDDEDGQQQRRQGEDMRQDRGRERTCSEERQGGGHMPKWWEREKKPESGKGKWSKNAKQDAKQSKVNEERRSDGGKGRPKWRDAKGQDNRRSRWREELAQQEARWTRRQEEDDSNGAGQKNAYSAFIQVLPVLLLVVISVVAQLTATTPSYSLHPKASSGLTVSRETQTLGILYFVRQDFGSRYQGKALEEFERTVEKDYVEHAQAECWKEKQQKSDLTNLARMYRDERLREKAESLKMENCQKLLNLIKQRKPG
ncbi:dnaJ homolog subfamily C member 18 [Xenopus laevis]|uniref:DnaJ homolog subfamily C member 18 n=1 Tax=Xenopus laevis TaxID=8355 RepID=A0A8J0U2G3_XENLA|nr:dnaJ homolog subfamily C member 18 [Xenopus laevis]OCT59526.1 hypothetical protein XELAEV_18000948mg [Xenopus laevis]